MKDSEPSPSYDWTGDRGATWTQNLDAMEAMLAPVDEPLIEALRLGEGPVRVADLGCGGGSTSRAVARAAHPDSEVVGFDISPDLLRAARRKTEDSSDAAALVRFVEANLETTPLPAPAFDRMTSRFGIMFFDDPEAVFAQWVGALRPGGKFAFAVWGPIERNPWMGTVREAVNTIVELPVPPAGAAGPFRYGDVSPLLVQLLSAGFNRVKSLSWEGEIALGGGMTASEAAGFAVAAFSTFRTCLEEKGPDAVRAAQARLRERFEPYQRNGVVRADAHVHIVTGERSPAS